MKEGPRKWTRRITAGVFLLAAVGCSGGAATTEASSAPKFPPAPTYPTITRDFVNEGGYRIKQLDIGVFAIDLTKNSYHAEYRNLDAIAELTRDCGPNIKVTPLDQSYTPETTLVQTQPCTIFEGHLVRVPAPKTTPRTR